MSGQATGWVLRHGPSPEMVDRDGVKYGARARGLRSVLLCVADAANVDGEHAHPGNENICSGSLYGRRQVSALLSDLVADGWLEVVETGGGRGRATVYRLLRMGVTETAQSAPRSAERNRAVAHEQPRGGASETARSETETARSPSSDQPLHVANGLVTEPLNGEDPTDPLCGFEHFWTTYPMRDGKRVGKADAVAQWRRLTLDEKRAAWRGARNYAAACDARITRAKDAHRWLVGRHWTDWQEPAVRDAQGSRRDQQVDRLPDLVRDLPPSMFGGVEPVAITPGEHRRALGL